MNFGLTFLATAFVLAKFDFEGKDSEAVVERNLNKETGAINSPPFFRVLKFKDFENYFQRRYFIKRKVITLQRAEKGKT